MTFRTRDAPEVDDALCGVDLARAFLLTDGRGGPRLAGMKIDVDALSLRELDALLVAAERRKAVLSRRRPVAVVRAELIAFVLSQGYAIDELVDAAPPVAVAARRAKKGKRAKVAAKYRDPQNRRNTWSGRGRMPRWLAEKTRRGQSPADFLIPGLARPTAKKSSPIGQRTVFKQG